MVENVVKNVMSINTLVDCLRGLCRHVLPRNASVVWASLTEVASSSTFSSSSSFFMTAKTPENTLFRPGFVFYGKKRPKFPKAVFYPESVFYTALA
jgi:hypothetical protein